MFSGKLHFTSFALLLAGTMAAAAAGNFAPPAEGPVAFRRDRVPLDVETIGKLSAQLVMLAKGLEGETSVERRGAAQMLALAIALDPGNAGARRVLEDFQNGKHDAEADAESLANSRARIWQWIGWLETAEAGADGQALAACLKDVAAISDPKDPRAEALLVKGEKGAWKDWIPSGPAYEEPKAVEPSPEEDIPWKTAEKSALLLTEATVSTPLWERAGKSDAAKWNLVLAPLKMSAVEGVTNVQEEEAPFALVLGKGERDGQLKPLTAPLLKLLTTLHGKLPAGCKVTIDSRELDASLASRKRQSISGAVAVLADSALTGVEPDATIIGTVDATGAFKLPTDFWDQLRAVEGGNGERLVLPAEAAAYLPSMLAMENPKFFMDHEVVLAADFKQLLSLSAKKPDEAVGKVSAQFREIREKMGSQPLGQYVANSFIRRRLAEITQAAPYHYSAKMLAIQGAGNRPIYVTRPVLISELRRVIEPIEWLAKRGNTQFLPAEVDAIGSSFESCRAEIERLLRYTEKSDRVVIDPVMDMVNLLRPLDRAARARPDPESYGMSPALESARTAFASSYANVSGALGMGPADGDQPGNR